MHKIHEKHKLTNEIILAWIHSINNKIYKETINKIRFPVKHNYCFRCVFFIYIPWFSMCDLFYFSFVWLHVYVFAIKSMVHRGSAFEPGASGLPYYCTPPVCVSDVIDALAVWRQNTKNRKLHLERKRKCKLCGGQTQDKSPTIFEGNPKKALRFLVVTETFIRKRWVWKGRFPNLVFKVEIVGGVGKILWDDKVSVSNFRFFPQIF